MSVPAPLALQALLPEQIAGHVPEVTLAEARKIVSAVHRGGAKQLRPSAAMSRQAVAAVLARGAVPELRLVTRTPSRIDPFVKYTLETPAGDVCEAVRVPLERAGRFTACISSQVGCAFGCAFCATGRMGLRRNLEAWEIVEQVRVIRADLPGGSRVHGVVFQGMGEPLANWEAVAQAARVFSEASAQAIDARGITICTAGIPSKIRALAEALPNVRLGISIGSARSGDLRKQLMPIEATHALSDVLAAAGDHARRTRHAPLWAYTLLAGVNDSDDEAVALARLAVRFASRYGVRPRVSVIPYNPIGKDDPFARTDPQKEKRFQDVIVQNGIRPIRRYSGGSDVGAACGQLASGGAGC
jgi:23S rRNA (adenine2503-C2)-methyltransferase